MPTIDQLAPAFSASDADEFVVSQGGIARKITLAQVLNGLQGKLAIPAGTLLGRSDGFGAPQVIAVGQNLSLKGSTLSATASPFVLNAAPTWNRTDRCRSHSGVAGRESCSYHLQPACQRHKQHG